MQRENLNRSNRSTRYPTLRRAMRTELSELDDAQIEELLQERFPESTPEEIESFAGWVRQAAKTAAPKVKQALPGAVQGAIQGGKVGGVYGAVAGAGIGTAMSLLGGKGKGKSQSKSQRPPSVAAPSTGKVTPPASTLVGSPVVRAQRPSLPTGPSQVVVSAGARPSSSAAELMALISRPETAQALLALLLSGLGRKTVAVGERNVPVAAFADAISELANEAVCAAAPVSKFGAFEFLADSEGMPRCDVANSTERAQLLLQDLAEASIAEPFAWRAFETVSQSGLADPGEDEEWVSFAGRERRFS